MHRSLMQRYIRIGIEKRAFHRSTTLSRSSSRWNLPLVEAGVERGDTAIAERFIIETAMRGGKGERSIAFSFFFFLGE